MRAIWSDDDRGGSGEAAGFDDWLDSIPGRLAQLAVAGLMFGVFAVGMWLIEVGLGQ